MKATNPRMTGRNNGKEKIEEVFIHELQKREGYSSA